MGVPPVLTRVRPRGGTPFSNSRFPSPSTTGKNPEAVFVDEIGGGQRLQQFTAAPDMQHRPIRRLQPLEFIRDMTAYVLRVLPVETIETMRDNVFRGPIEHLPDRVVALMRP